MSVTLASITPYLNTYFRDASTDSVTDAERIQAINEATVWLMEQTTNDHVIRTYDIDYVDGLHYYKITSSIADLLEPADLRRGRDLQGIPATRKSSREMAEDIGTESSEFAFAVERKNGNAYLVINLAEDTDSSVIATFDSTTADGGTWAADTTNSDALNVTSEIYEFTQGTGSVEFDVDVSQSGNNRATISSTITSKDLESLEDIGVFTLDVYIPDSTYMSSVTLYWGTDDANYWSSVQTTDAQGNTIADGWNTFKFEWRDSTKTLTPDSADIAYVRIDVNYTASQTDDTGFRLDNLTVSRPEKLTFFYLSDRVGVSSAGATLYRYTATTDIPYYSGQYDNYIYPVAHKAAAILFRSVYLHNDAITEDNEANKALAIKIKLFPSSIVKEDRGFKTKQINLNRGKRKFN